MIALKGLFAGSKWHTKIALLIGIPLFLSIMSSIICVLINAILDINMQTANTPTLLGIQAFQSILTFIVGGWLYAYLIAKDPMHYLGLHTLKSPWLYIIACISMFTLIPLVNITALWNNSIQLPEALQTVEKFMRSLETAANDITIKMLQGDGIGSIAMALVAMALIPAIGEELLFRGGLQKGIENKTGNAHLAVWVTAFVFSFIHFQFYGFIPRLILGAALGYFYVYGKSLWISIWAHFVNNATSVLSYKLLYQYSAETNLSTMGAPTGLEQTIMVALALFSLATYVATMSIFVFVARNRKAQ
jgi:membrane protease YdiL (CAAX protease family)